MMKYLTQTTLALLLCLAANLLSAQSETAEQTIHSRISAFSKALVAQDFDAVANAYTGDARIFPPGQNIVEGRAAIKATWTAGGRITAHKITPSEIKIIGSEAYDWGIYEGKSLDKNGAEISWRGKYVIVWKEVSPGDWRMYLDIWNRMPD